MNEEEVKVRIILPWLHRLGISTDEILLETSFTVRIGTNTVVFNGRPGRSHLRARLDILVRRRDVNLLVIEVKGPSATLSEDDRDQAISYARLVHPVAPFAAVTNGEAFKLYDAITKEPLALENIDFSKSLPSLPDACRSEALRIFLGTSPANLIQFCRAQTDRVLSPLFGEPNDLSATYIPKTHVERAALVTQLWEFLAARNSLFVLGGESGMGKSCVMIDFARVLLEAGYPALFFRGALIQGDILDEIAQEAEWAFDHKTGSADTLKHLAKGSGDKPLIIMIDAIEDWTYSARVQSLVSLASKIEGLNVRLMVSCKTVTWGSFTSLLGSRSGIDKDIYRPNDKDSFSAQVGPFTPREFFLVLDKCRKTYNMLRRAIDSSALREARRSPFILRLMFQVTAEEAPNHEPIIAIHSIAFLEQYIHLAAKRTGNEQVTVNTLLAVAKVIYERKEEWVDEPDLRSTLNMSVTDTLPGAIFEQGLLAASGNLGVRKIRFSFGQLRNYIIVFHIRRWQQLSAEAFVGEIKAAASSPFTAELLNFYYPFANDAQKVTVEGPVRCNAHEYLRQYVSLIGDFPQLREAFIPGTSGKIGFAGELRFPPYIAWYGFRGIAASDPEILLIPVDAEDPHTTRLFSSGVTLVQHHGALDGFRRAVPYDRVLIEQIIKQLEELIRYGRLNEACAPQLADELVACVISSKMPRLVDPSTKKIRYPIQFDAVKKELTREALYLHFMNELVQAKLVSGEIRDEWQGGVRSYSYSIRAEEREQLLSRADAALASGESVSPDLEDVDSKSLGHRLLQAFDASARQGNCIDGPVFPLLDEIAAVRTVSPPSYNKVREHCRQVLHLALSCYRRMVSRTFRILQGSFGSIATVQSKEFSR